MQAGCSSPPIFLPKTDRSRFPIFAHLWPRHVGEWTHATDRNQLAMRSRREGPWRAHHRSVDVSFSVAKQAGVYIASKREMKQVGCVLLRVCFYGGLLMNAIFVQFARTETTIVFGREGRRRFATLWTTQLPLSNWKEKEKGTHGNIRIACVVPTRALVVLYNNDNSYSLLILKANRACVVSFRDHNHGISNLSWYHYYYL